MDAATLGVILPGLPLHQAVVTLVHLQIVNANATSVEENLLVPANLTIKRHTAITRQIYVWGVRKGITELLVVVLTIMDLVILAQLFIISKLLEHLLEKLS